VACLQLVRAMIARGAIHAGGIWRGSLHLRFTLPWEVTLPDLSTWTSGPSQATSKYDLMVMLYAEGVKNRLLAGARIEEALARKAEAEMAERSGACIAADGGVTSTLRSCRCCQTHRPLQADTVRSSVRLRRQH
jgi:hypothetical protein